MTNLGRASWRAAVLALVAWPCCVSVLDLDDYNDAVDALCECDQALPELDGTCDETLRTRLGLVSEAARGSWLAFYAEECRGTCTNAFACFQQVGTCAQRQCTSHRECCGWADNGGNRCIGEECQLCRQNGAQCDESDDCCDPEATCMGTCEVGGSSSSVSTGGGPDDAPPAE